MTIKAVVCWLCFCIALVVGFAAIPVHGAFDLLNITQSSPSSGSVRLYGDSSTGRLACKDSSGADCMPPGGRAVDVAPASPNALDDEFSGGAVDAKWTQSQASGSGQSITVANGMLIIRNGVSTQNRVYGIHQPISGSSWKVRAKMSIEAAVYNYIGVGMYVKRTTGAEKWMFGQLAWHSSYGLPGFYFMKLNGANSFVSEADAYDYKTNELYMEIEYDGTNITWNTSQTGASFNRYFSEAAATFLGGAPEFVGIAMHAWGDGSANHNQTVTFDWFRRIN